MKTNCKWRKANYKNSILASPAINTLTQSQCLFGLKRRPFIIRHKISSKSEPLCRNTETPTQNTLSVNCIDDNDVMFSKWKILVQDKQINEETRKKKLKMIEEQKLEMLKNSMDDMLDKIRMEEISNTRKHKKNQYSSDQNYISLIKLKKNTTNVNEKALSNQNSRIKDIDDYTGMLKQEITNNKAIFANSFNQKKIVLENALHNASQNYHSKIALLKAIKEGFQDQAMVIMEKCNELIHEHYAVSNSFSLNKTSFI